MWIYRLEITLAWWLVGFPVVVWFAGWMTGTGGVEIAVWAFIGGALWVARKEGGSYWRWKTRRQLARRRISPWQEAILWLLALPLLVLTVSYIILEANGVNYGDGPEPSGWRALMFHAREWTGWWLSGIVRFTVATAFGLAYVFMWPGRLLTGGENMVTAVGSAAATWAVAIFAAVRIAGLHDPFRPWLRWGGGMAWLIGLWDWWEMIRRFGKGPSASWAGLVEMIEGWWGEDEVFLGRPWTRLGGFGWPVGVATEKHMVTIAGTGSGKSTAALIPNLCLHRGSLLCIDPKGELAAVTAGRRRALLQDVHILDPFSVVPGAERSSYNPFDEMAAVEAKNPDMVVSFAARVAEALVKPLSEKDAYWDKAAKTLIGGLVLYIFAHELPERRTLMRLRELVTEGDVEGYEYAVEQGLVDPKKDDRFDFLLQEMRSVREEKYGGPIARAAGTIMMMAGPQRGSVVTTAQEHTAFLDNPVMEKVLKGKSDSPLLLRDLKERPLSVYVCLPVTAVNGPEGRWLRLFVLLFIEAAMADAMKAVWPPVLLAIDEFPNLGKLEGIELIAPMMRSYGVRFWAVGQDVSQFSDTYPSTWTGFIGGAEAVQFMGVTHPPTVDFLCDLLGHHEVQRAGEGLRAFPLLDRDQLMRFLAKARGNQVVWYGSRRAMRLKVCPYFEYMPPWYYDADPRYGESRWRSFWRGIGRKRGWGA